MLQMMDILTYIIIVHGYKQTGQDAQTISLSGNVLTISGSNSNVDFTSAPNINTDAQDLIIKWQHN